MSEHESNSIERKWCLLGSIACLGSILGSVLALWAGGLIRDFGRSNIYLLAAIIFLLSIPHLFALSSMHGKPGKSGLACAVIYGSLGVIFWGFMIVSPRLNLPAAVQASLQILLVVAAAKIYHRQGWKAGDWSRWLGGASLVLTCLVLSMWSLVAFVTSPSGHRTAESEAVSRMHRIIGAQYTYAATKGSFGNLEDLIAAGLIDDTLISGNSTGYVFSLVSDGSTFSLAANPRTRGKTGIRSFYTNQFGVIHYTTEDRSARQDDPPLGQ